MSKVDILVRRLKKLNIDVIFIANYPWIYIDTVNGIKVKAKHVSKYGFTSFMLTQSGKFKFYSKETFDIIRVILKDNI